jgi:hypothetical protein
MQRLGATHSTCGTGQLKADRRRMVPVVTARRSPAEEPRRSAGGVARIAENEPISITHNGVTEEFNDPAGMGTTDTRVGTHARVYRLL